MSTQTNTKGQMHVQAAQAQPEKEAPAYSMEFLAMMLDGGWATLETYLTSQGIEPKVLKLLEQLLHLSTIQRLYEKEPHVLYIWNNEASEAIAHLSKLIPALGGRFLTRYGEVLKA
jgi:hypothetical protein